MDKKHEESTHTMSYKRDMYNQKNEKIEQERREYYEEDLKDETMLKNIKSKIAEDDFKLMKHTLEMNEMLESQAERKVIREQHKAFDAQEKDEEREMVDRDAIVSAHRAEEIEQRQQSNANTSAAVEANEAEAKGYPHPQYNDYEKRYMQDYIDRKEGVKQAGRDNQEGLIRQMKYKVDSAEKERVLDAAFYKSNEEKMFENDEEERLNKLKKKEIQMQYGEDLRQQILENASRRKREHEAENKRDSNANAAKWGWSASETVREVQEYDKA